jgi:hypothetical protein
LVVPSTDCPGAVLANVLETSENIETAKRVELFAKAQEKVFGILHTFFVAYSCERMLLQLAEDSSNVVQVRTFGSQDDSSSTSILQDYLILKSICRENQEEMRENGLPYRPSTPEILVPTHWSMRMKLKNGDKIIICRPSGEYCMAPPDISGLSL